VAGEGGARARLAFEGYPAAVQFDDGLYQGQPQTGATTLMAAEAIEDVSLDVERDPSPAVGDLDADFAERPLGPTGSPFHPGAYGGWRWR